VNPLKRSASVALLLMLAITAVVNPIQVRGQDEVQIGVLLTPANTADNIEIFDMAIYGNHIYIAGRIYGRASSLEVIDYDGIVAKLTLSGEPVWAKRISGSEYDSAWGIAIASDGSIYVTGGSNRDAYVAKFDENGNLVWFRTIGGSNYDWGSNIAAAPDGSIYVVGSTNSFSAENLDVFVAKLDSNGNLLWFKTIGTANDDWGSDIVVAPDGSVYVAGHTLSSSGDFDVLIAKFDQSGNLMWFRTIGGSDDDYSDAIGVAHNGSVYVVGGTYSFGAGDEDIFVAKFDSSGKLLWFKTIGTPDWEEAYNVIVAPDGTVYVAGTISTSAFLAKIGANGKLVWLRTIDISGESEADGFGLAVTSCGRPIVAGVHYVYPSYNAFVAWGYTNEIDHDQLSVEDYTDSVSIGSASPSVSSPTNVNVATYVPPMEDYALSVSPVYGVGLFECSIAPAQQPSQPERSLGGVAESLGYELVAVPAIATILMVIAVVTSRR